MENKVLCCCHNVTVEDVKKHIDQGVTNFEDLQAKTGIATDCPPCKENNEKVFKNMLEQKDEVSK